MRGERDFGSRGPRGSQGNNGPRGNFGSRPFRSGPREMHKATCADCGNECEVPFKPSGEKPVYCRDCYSKHKPKRF